jgi:hypothetical protein
MSTPALSCLQEAFRRQILGSEEPALAAAIVGDRIPAAARLRIHRHHVLASLTAALAATFSTVEAVVGADFFAGMARAFILKAPPAQPVLSEYGADFPAFVGAWPDASGLPYLADVARLDWALNLAYGAPQVPALRLEDLAAVPPDELPGLPVALKPGVAIITSAYPIDRIWVLSHRPDEAGDDPVALDAGAVRLLVFPRTDDAAFIALDACEAALAVSLLQGKALGEAFKAAAAAGPDGDPRQAMGRLLAVGALSAEMVTNP